MDGWEEGRKEGRKDGCIHPSNSQLALPNSKVIPPIILNGELFLSV
jgi:hypothetical protein